jgi:hypothetical protein
MCLYLYAKCFDLYLGHPQACQYKNLKKEDVIEYTLNLRGPLFQSLFSNNVTTWNTKNIQYEVYDTPTRRRQTSLYHHLELYRDPQCLAEFKEESILKIPRQVKCAKNRSILVRTFTTTHEVLQLITIFMYIFSTIIDIVYIVFCIFYILF